MSLLCTCIEKDGCIFHPKDLLFFKIETEKDDSPSENPVTYQQSSLELFVWGFKDEKCVRFTFL